VQANLLCTTARTKSVIVSLALVSASVSVGCYLSANLYAAYLVAFHVALPLTVLSINLVVVCEVRRASNAAASLRVEPHHPLTPLHSSGAAAAASLGVQPHHPSTPFHSSVPTVMLVATSLVYVLLRASMSVLTLVVMNQKPWATTTVWDHGHTIADALSKLVFAYNFYVYLVTGKQFRARLRAIFCRCFSAAAAADSAATVVADNSNDAGLAAQAESIV